MGGEDMGQLTQSQELSHPVQALQAVGEQRASLHGDAGPGFSSKGHWQQ